MIAAINAHMIGTPSEPGEHVDWDSPDVMSRAEWYDLLGCTVEEFAETSPHMIVWEVPFRCSECGCNVAPDHTPGDDHCEALRRERDRSRRG